MTWWLTAVEVRDSGYNQCAGQSWLRNGRERGSGASQVVDLKQLDRKNLPPMWEKQMGVFHIGEQWVSWKGQLAADFAGGF